MAQKTPSRRKTSTTRRKAAPDHRTRNRAIAGVTAIGAIAAGIGAAFRLGWLDQLFPNKGGEHAAPDLAAGAPVPGTDRAPDAFRPDPTAPVPAADRESLRPAAGPSPTLVQDRGTLNGQGAPANG